MQISAFGLLLKIHLLCKFSKNAPSFATIAYRPPLAGLNLVVRFFHDENGVNSERGVLGKLLTRLTQHLSILQFIRE